MLKTHLVRAACLVLLLDCATAAFARTPPAAPASVKPAKKSPVQEPMTEHVLKVTAFAYNADSSQTDGSKHYGAWGDRLDKDVQSVAVSRDLHAMGLTRGTKLRIKGLKGEFVVLDLMNRRWKKSIDIFKGKKKEARRWGRRRVQISWKTKTGDSMTAQSGNAQAEAAVPASPPP